MSEHHLLPRSRDKEGFNTRLKDNLHHGWTRKTHNSFHTIFDKLLPHEQIAILDKFWEQLAPDISVPSIKTALNRNIEHFYAENFVRKNIRHKIITLELIQLDINDELGAKPHMVIENPRGERLCVRKKVWEAFQDLFGGVSPHLVLDGWLEFSAKVLSERTVKTLRKSADTFIEEPEAYQLDQAILSRLVRSKSRVSSRRRSRRN